MANLFKTDVLGIGPFCVEFDDGEIVTTRDEKRQHLIAAASDMYDALKAIKQYCDDPKYSLGSKGSNLLIAVISKVEGCK